MLRTNRHFKTLFKAIILIVALGLFLLQSCDPARILLVKTADKPNYSVTVYANENILPRSYPYNQDSIAKKTVIHVPTTDSIPQREKIYLYGMYYHSKDFFVVPPPLPTEGRSGCLFIVRINIIKCVRHCKPYFFIRRGNLIKRTNFFLQLRLYIF